MPQAPDRPRHRSQKKGLAEGRKPALRVASDVAAAKEETAEYIRFRAFDDGYFCDFILDYLQTSLRGHVDVRSTSARWAWVEYVMAQGGFDMADVAVEAWKNGGSFAAWKKAIQNHARSEQPDDTALRLGLPTGRFAGEVHPADFLP